MSEIYLTYGGIDITYPVTYSGIDITYPVCFSELCDNLKDSQDWPFIKKEFREFYVKKLNICLNKGTKRIIYKNEYVFLKSIIHIRIFSAVYRAVSLYLIFELIKR